MFWIYLTIATCFHFCLTSERLSLVVSSSVGFENWTRRVTKMPEDVRQLIFTFNNWLWTIYLYTSESVPTISKLAFLIAGAAVTKHTQYIKRCICKSFQTKYFKQIYIDVYTFNYKHISKKCLITSQSMYSVLLTCFQFLLFSLLLTRFLFLLFSVLFTSYRYLS